MLGVTFTTVNDGEGAQQTIAFCEDGRRTPWATWSRAGTGQSMRCINEDEAEILIVGALRDRGWNIMTSRYPQALA